VTDRDFTLKLARMLIVAAWADGAVHPAELTALRHLIGNLPGISGPDWLELNELIEHPLDTSRREEITRELVEAIRTKREKEAVMESLIEVAHADGVVTAEEQALLDSISQAIEARGTGLAGQFSRWVSAVLRR
jgi:tellurite resistance protein